jgi:hypothetical protein
MKLDNINVISKNVLSNDEIAEIYDRVKESYNEYVNDSWGQQVADFRMPESVLEKIVKLSEDVFGKPGLVLEAYQFARYEKFTAPDGSVSIPRLMPHRDFFTEPRYTFDYQIGSNVSWPIFVEGEEFTLSDNEALTFSGTHQVHWRPKQEWTEGEFVDMIFCHLQHPGDDQITPEYQESMKKRAQSYQKSVGEW